MRIVVTETAPEGWDAFVASHPEATAYHLASAVEIGRRAFGLHTLFIAARCDSGELCGVLPLVEQASPLFGRFLTSLPFVNYGGLLAADAATAQALAAAAADCGAERGAKHVELRHSGEGPPLDLPCRVDKVSMVLSLPRFEEELARQLGAKLRSQIKRAERSHPEVQWGGPELLPEFHRVFSVTMRDLGTPSYPLSFFDSACRALGNSSRVLLVRARGKVAAASVVVRHPGRVEVPWAAATQEAKRDALNMRLYWEMLRYVIQSGAPAFDFGRSTVGGGTYRFKEQWGAKPLQLRWHYWLRAGGALPMLNPQNARFALATAAWRKLPVWLATRLGPLIVRHLP